MEKYLKSINEFKEEVTDVIVKRANFAKSVFTGMFKLVFGNQNYMKKMFVEQLYFFGALSFPMVAIVSFFLGLVLTLQLIPELGKFGSEIMTGGLVMVSVAREVSPVVISFMTAGRMGSAMAAELGSMKITDQIDALKLMAVDPVEYLVSPRILSSIIMLPFLTMLSIFSSGLASYIMAVGFYGLSWGEYLARISIMLQPKDVIGGVLKTVFFGFSLSYIACRKGMELRGRSSEIGKATTDSVAAAIMSIIIINLVLSYMIFVT